jgi:uncharacterized BrkB/YihY/UPF0761 family membrane protein
VGGAGAGALVERLRIPMLIFTSTMVLFALYYAFVRRPTRRNQTVAVVSALVAVAATTFTLLRG